MTRRLDVRLLAAAALVVLVAATVASATTRPAVRLAKNRPVTVQGVGFRANEAVRVRVTMDLTSLASAVRADATGRFTARFKAVYRPCASSLVIVARGARSGVVYGRVPIAECAVP